jgi:hypothetical protein
MRVWDPTPIEAQASRPHTGLLMTSDVAGARPWSPGSGEGQRIPERVCMARERAGVPSKLLAAGPLAHDRRLVALCGARVVTIGGELGPEGLELGVWLARALPRYAARNFSIEKTVPRDNM